MKTTTIRTTLILSIILSVASLSAAKAIGECNTKCHEAFLAAQSVCQDASKERDKVLAPQRDLFNKGVSNTFLEQEGASNRMLTKCINDSKIQYKTCEEKCPK